MPDSHVVPILYIQAGCAESDSVRAWLTEHGISFVERDASADPEAAVALVDSGTFATPLVVVGEEIVLGFRPDTLSSMLEDIRDPVR